MPDYSKGKIYRILQDNVKTVYIGSTTQPLSSRMAQHRKGIVHHPEYKLYKIMGDVGVDHFGIELVVDFPCQRGEQLKAEEGRHIRLNNTVEEGNKNIAGREKKECEREHYLANAEKLKAYQVEYKAANPEKVAARNKAYRDRQDKAQTAAYMKGYYEQHKEETAISRNSYNKAYRLRKKAERLAANQPVENNTS